jgi:GNAT superfamily N-acetyltransferase
MKREFLIRAYREGDEEGIFELWKAVYPSEQRNREEWMRWWHWMYKEVPYGSSIWLAEDKGKIVGQYCVRIVNLKFKNNIIKAVHSLDTATHPDYQRLGIMLTLSRKMFDELAKNAINIIYGFPNEIAYPNDIRLGFYDIAAMRKMIKVIQWENVLKTRINNRLFIKLLAVSGIVLNKILFRTSNPTSIKGLSIAQVSHFDDRINEFWTRVSSQFPIIVERSEKYLNWRYTNVPNKSYSIYLAEKDKAVYGYLVLRSHQVEDLKVAVICDLFAESEEISQCLLHYVTEGCKKDGADYIHWGGIANKNYLGALRKRGFIFLPFQKHLSRFVVYLSASDISKEFLIKPQNWLIQGGDTDTL